MTDLHDLTSIRTDGDSWEITESVGATALGVAAARAVETARHDFAYLLVASISSSMLVHAELAEETR